jgi:hypothetical protein
MTNKFRFWALMAFDWTFIFYWAQHKILNQRLFVFERKVLRTIYGPKIVDGTHVCRCRYNFELKREFNRPNVIGVVKSNRLRYAEHIVLSFILPHVNYGNIVFTGADFASQRSQGVAFKACLRYIHMKKRLDHVSHLETTVTGTLLVDNARIQLLSFLYKKLHVRHSSYLFSMFHFASSVCTRNLTVPPHRTLAMNQSFMVLGCRAWDFPWDGQKDKRKIIILNIDSILNWIICDGTKKGEALAVLRWPGAIILNRRFDRPNWSSSNK